MPVSHDLQVSEEFHRAKRTFMLYSGIIIILSGVTINNSGVTLSVLGGVSLSLPLARIILWFASTYYFIQYFLEFRLIRFRNSSALSRLDGSIVDRLTGNVNSYAALLADTESRIGVLNSIVKSTIDRHKGMRESEHRHQDHLKDTAEKAIRYVPEAVKSASAGGLGFSDEIQKDVANFAKDHIAHVLTVYQTSHSLLETIHIYQLDHYNEIKNNLDIFHNLNSEVDKLRGLLKSISLSVSRRQIIYLWGWELLLPVMLYLFAACLAIEPIFGLSAITTATHEFASWLESRTPPPPAR
jgi:hypothetical protein